MKVNVNELGYIQDYLQNVLQIYCTSADVKEVGLPFIYMLRDRYMYVFMYVIRFIL